MLGGMTLRRQALRLKSLYEAIRLRTAVLVLTSRPPRPWALPSRAAPAQTDNIAPGGAAPGVVGSPEGGGTSNLPGHRVGYILPTLTGTNRAVVHFHNQRGTAEQWIKEGKEATHWTRLSCHR